MIFAIANATARTYTFRKSFFFFSPHPDTPANKTDTTGDDDEDTAHKLRFPIYDETGDPRVDHDRPGSMDLHDPKNVHKEVNYVPDSNRYEFNEKFGDNFLRNPTYLTFDEYEAYRQQVDMDDYWQRRLDGLMLFNKTPPLPQMYKEGLFDRIFGNNSISVKPQGNVDVTFGGNWQNIKNPTLVQSAQKYGVFNFDMQMNINLLATVGDKLKFNISNNTKATFDYQNMQKLDYSGKEDEMLKKIEAGNISFPLKTTLISGVQSLFGIKTQLQFGKLWVTAVLSQQKSSRKSLTIQGGAQSQLIAIKADNYDENKDFLLSQYFHDNYDQALANYPVINSLVTISKIEVWVTNKTGAVTNVRNIVGLMDLGEANPYQKGFLNPSSGIRNGLPDNRTNREYTEIEQNPNARPQSTSTEALTGMGLIQGQDFETTFARELSSSEYTFNSQLGYIMLNTTLNPDDVVGVAFRYTYRGQVYQVGEFAEDLPPDTSNTKVLYVKLLKGTSARPFLPVWKLMMKNIYSLGSVGVTKDNFILNVMYQDPGGGELRYMPEGPLQGTPFLTILNLDRLNAMGEPQPDGIFDFVDGITINSQQGKIIFPELEPFGSGLAAAIGTGNSARVLNEKYNFQILYDSTKTIAQESQTQDRYILRGSFKSSSSNDIFLGGFNIPPGSVTVSAGGTKLVENTDYTIDYSLGKIKILNTGILNSGVPINVQYEDNATFGFQQQNLMAARIDYYANKNLTLGGTIMRLNERPFTQQVSYGDDPIKNTVIGLDANYQAEEPAVTRTLDKLPIYSTTSPSFLNGALEVAALLPGHPKQIDQLDPEGSIYIDNFEGTTSAYDLKFPAISWSLASTPYGAVNQYGQTLFPESTSDDQLVNGLNRGLMSWYTLEPTLVDPGGGIPSYVKLDTKPNKHYIRMVQEQDVFPNLQTAALQSALSTFDIAYYPRQRGPYNFDVNPTAYSKGVNADGTLAQPQTRWGGIMRPIQNTDFEASNVEFIHFWVMDPFIADTNSQGGQLYIDLGDVSEDVLKDSRMFFENSIPNPFDGTKLDTTAWGYVPKFEQQITRAFDNDPNARVLQDVGYDGLPDVASVPGQLDEQHKFLTFLNQMSGKFGGANAIYLSAFADPSNDDYHYYRGSDFDSFNNNNGMPVLMRYKRYNNSQGNSPITSASSSYSSAETTIPESEDINQDNTLNENESYFQYRVNLTPSQMVVGKNNIISIEDTLVTLADGTQDHEKWYEFKIPIENYDHAINGISDFRSIRFMRMFMSGWTDSAILRFATLELGRNQWRTYNYSLATPGENLPQQNSSTTDFTVTSVSIEQNASRYPIPYVIPPGVSRQLNSVSSGQTILLNEQSLSLKSCALADGDARAVYKSTSLDMRQYTYLRMFIHAEGVQGTSAVNNGDVYAFIRIGSDFTDNYYEYRMPLTMTPFGAASADVVWPASNEMDIVLQDLVTAKKNRDAAGVQTYVPYNTTDSKGNTIVVVGNPNIGGVRDLMLGVLNPKKTPSTPGDDGEPKCTEIWFDELRMAGINDQAGYAASGKATLQLADLGNLNVSGSMHTPGYGTIDQKIEQRSQDNYDQLSASTSLALGKLLPKSWGVTLPFYMGYTENVSNPKYDPNDEDVLVSDEMKMAKTAAARDSIKKATQDFTSITSFNFSNVRIQGNTANPSKKIRMPWSIKNFDFSFSYNDQYKHNPTVAMDNLITERLGIGYNYSIKMRAIEPFRNLIHSRSKWFALIRDFNFTPLPSTFTVRSDLNRADEETVVRNVDGGPYAIPPTFYKNFTWTRTYNVRWSLTKSLSLDYSATNIARIDEPYGLINTKEKRDSLLDRLLTFGHPTSYSQTFSTSYDVPLTKLPATDWITVKLGYAATYNWVGAAPVAYELGNTITNTDTKKISAEFNFTKLYDKNRYLRALNSKPPPKPAPGKPGQSQGGGSKSVKDLRKPPSQGSLLPGASNSGDINDAGAPQGGSGGSQGSGGVPQGGSNASGSGSNQNGGGQGGNTAGGSSGGSSSGASNNSGAGEQSGGGNANNTSSNASAGGNAGSSGAGNAASGPPSPPANANGSPLPPGNGGNSGQPGAGGNSTAGGGNMPGNGGGGNKGGGNKGNNGNNANNGNGGNGSNGGGNTAGNGNPAGINNTNFNTVFQNINTAGMTDEQLDSVVDWLATQDEAKAAALRAKIKAAKKAARKARKAKTPELNTAEEIIGHILTMVTDVKINYTQNGGTTLPGYMDSTRFMGINNYTGAPGMNFVYGYQPDASWLAAQAAAGRLTTDSLFNAQFLQTYSQTYNATAAIQPFKNFRIDLSLTSSFSKSRSELYADTGGNTGYHVFNPYQTGSFNVSYIALSSMFKNPASGSALYQQFLNDGPIISQRLGRSNPYTNGLPDPQYPNYDKGYGPFSQDVLIPAFLAAFTGQNASTAALINYKNADNIESNPFKYYYPMPNWRIAYTGLSKLPFFSDIFSNFVINHAYTGSLSMSGFTSNLLFTDLYGLGFPSFIDSVSHNYIPFYQVPNVTIAQAFNPLIGFDAALKNNLTLKFEVRESNTEALSLVDYQIASTQSTEYVVGFGFRKKNVRLPFRVFGYQRLKNELILKVDLGLRNDMSTNTFLSDNISVISRGQKVIRISPTLDYSVTQNLTLHFFFDRQQTIPYVSNSYPTTTTRAGLTLRFIFAK